MLLVPCLRAVVPIQCSLFSLCVSRRLHLTEGALAAALAAAAALALAAAALANSAAAALVATVGQ